MPWPPRSDEVFKCLWRMFKECSECDRIPVGLDTQKEVHNLWGESGISVPIGGVIQSGSVELEDVSELAFTVQRFAGHCGLSVYANLQTSPDDINWDTCNYAGFTNIWFCKDLGLSAQCTLPITTGPKYIRAEIENESMNDITIRAWLTLTKTC